ncbi:hypothetical protein R75461_02683 [Paraburkholderia nemoris]|jgi:ACT domain-containing protein|uniref:ACT domain-containing protein n=1 Tax=Paraburkholderia caffeinilytica TaxID=1761016 RepID=A0ABQ1NAE6_9BURK|nr:MULTISPECIES: amino acid-binding ACT domain-containing protein [Paraburkholderia]MBK3783777.1 amino acid-binding ACT domain-containing protein [Paraburkholderia aspalathi]CAB3798014.1 hypothetical protein LMG28690_04642 [Paraburkholderia caffeinilytica]CAE6745607.1 hypothetical protein R75461_02683 [Paraburkholderia nemoris]CAE6832008.1 hypothetical protein LMG22931_06846 [Paraburkholderia nemoris]GGC63064.1 hypothetical protein GCM10011400_58690 [Paraburkholderia caffeinilytica]
MKNLAIALVDRPGTLAEMTDALDRAGVRIEGGGVFVVDGCGVGHFLVKDVSSARRALLAANIQVLSERDVVIPRLNQSVGGQFSHFMRRMADAGINIEVLYTDRHSQVVIVVDDIEASLAVNRAWDIEQDMLWSLFNDGLH